MGMPVSQNMQTAVSNTTGMPQLQGQQMGGAPGQSGMIRGMVGDPMQMANIRASMNPMAQQQNQQPNQQPNQQQNQPQNPAQGNATNTDIRKMPVLNEQARGNQQNNPTNNQTVNQQNNLSNQQFINSLFPDISNPPSN